MATLIQKIAKGNRKALTQSYEENKERVYYIAQSIDKSQASKATIWAFKNVWNDIISTSNIRENDFDKLVVWKLASYLQRNSANAKKDTLDRCEKLSIEFSMNHENISIPNDVNASIAETIDRIASPVEAHDKTTIITVGIIAAIVIVCIVSMSLLFSNTGDDSNTDDTELVGNDTDFAQSGKNTSGDSSSNSSSSSTDSSTITSVDDIDVAIDENLTYYADIVIDDYGTITVELDYETAPITVANFVALAQSGFYDGLTFHRIIEGFMMQGGDPNGNGTGGSENNIYGEFSVNGWDNDLSHKRGVISMARSNAYNSASSQFFIMHEDYTGLDGQYASFGYVVDGLDVVDDVCETAEPTDNNGTISSNKQPVIKTITIRTEEKSAE